MTLLLSEEFTDVKCLLLLWKMRQLFQESPCLPDKESKKMSAQPDSSKDSPDCKAGPGLCAHLLTLFSLFLIVIFLPFSLICVIKVVQVRNK